MAAWFIRLLMRSCRVAVVEGIKEQEEALAKSGGRAVYVTWHQRMSYHFYYGGFRGITIMVSKSRDGEYAARLAYRLGYRCVRGSSTLGAIEALREMIRITKAGCVTGMLADGPQGPPRIVKLGTVAIARASGLPVLGVVWGADRAWVFNSWDRYMVPKPFARIAIYHCNPVWVPADARGPDLERCRKEVEDELNKATRWCDLYFGRERPWRKASAGPEIGPL